MSGRDRRHYTAELRKAESEYRRLTCEAAAAHEAAERQFAEAHRLDCLAWSALQFTGGPEAPSPTIAAALHGGVEILEVQCRHCNHAELIDLAGHLAAGTTYPHFEAGALLREVPERARQEAEARPDWIAGATVR